jgi:DNA-binding PadR family transcriptional regulator
MLVLTEDEVMLRDSAKGFLAEEWGMTETNREAKFYRLTPAGKKQLASELARWRDYARLMTAALAASR